MFSYGFFCVTYCRTAGNFLFTVPCVSFRLIRNTGFGPVSFWRGDLRRRTEISQPPDYRTYSPEVTSLRSNLPVHRICKRLRACYAHCARTGILYRKTQLVSSVFFYFVYKISEAFSAVLTKFRYGVRRAVPLPPLLGSRQEKSRRKAALLAVFGERGLTPASIWRRWGCQRARCPGPSAHRGCGRPRQNSWPSWRRPGRGSAPPRRHRTRRTR